MFSSSDKADPRKTTIKRRLMTTIERSTQEENVTLSESAKPRAKLTALRREARGPQPRQRRLSGESGRRTSKDADVVSVTGRPDVADVPRTPRPGPAVGLRQTCPSGGRGRASYKRTNPIHDHLTSKQSHTGGRSPVSRESEFY